MSETNDEDGQSTLSTTYRGAKAIRVTDGGENPPETVSVTVALWVFVIGTVPFFVISAVLLWLDPSLVVATLTFWLTGIPL